MVRAIFLFATAQRTIEQQMAGIGRGLFVLLALALIAMSASGQVKPSAVTWNEKIVVAAGGGFRGPWRMNESEYDYLDPPRKNVPNSG